MRVRCSLCSFESRGICQKKKNNGEFIKVKINKPRKCSLYKEDSLKVLSQYRKQEAHKKLLEEQELNRVKIKNFLRSLEEKRQK